MLRRFTNADWILLGIFISITALIQFLIFQHFTDDAYITLRYAARLLAGQGLTFNDGERVEGFSNPLWLLLIAGTSALTHISLVLAAKLLGYAALAGTAFYLYRICIQLEASILTFILSLGLLLGTPGVQIYAGLGMEVPLLMLLLTAGLYYSLDRPYTAAFCFSLVALTRPEGLLYATLWGVTYALITDNKPGYFKQLVLMGLLTLTLPLAYLAFRLSYYGEWVPNTAIAKLPHFWGEFAFDEWVPYLPLPLLMLVCALFMQTRPAAKLTHLCLLGASILASGVMFSCYAGADWMAYGRFILPLCPVVFVLVSALFCPPLEARRPVCARSVIIAIIALNAGYGLFQAMPYISNNGIAPMLMRGQDQVSVGQWLAQTYPKPLTIGTARIGAVSYFAPQHTFKDFLGLTDAAQAHSIRDHWPDATYARVYGNNAIIRAQPDLLLIHRPPAIAGTPLYLPIELALLEANYTCVRQFPQGHWGTFDLWIKPSVPLATREKCIL